jgi:hypothetical protein
MILKEKNEHKKWTAEIMKVGSYTLNKKDKMQKHLTQTAA